MPVPIPGPAAPSLRMAVACMVLGLVGAVTPFFGTALQRVPSNFGPCSVVFTIPLGIAGGWLVATISEKRHMTTLHFLLLLAAVAVVGGGAALEIIAAQQ